MTTFTAQDLLFRKIKELLPGDISIADSISEILHVSTDSAYRRIRGETPLVLDELISLCHHYNISFDQFVENDNNSVLFKNTRISNQGYTYPEYLEGLTKLVKGVEVFDNKEVIYMSKDLPIFYNFYFRPLIAFRYFFWMKIQFLHPEFEHKSFDIELLPTAIEEQSRELIKSYNKIPSTEIWNMESINSTISQIEFSRSSGHFGDITDVRKIYKALEDSILHVQEQAEHGCKFMPGEDPGSQPQNLKFFFNRVVLGDNTIMVNAGNMRSAFINYGHLNYLVTNDKKFCDDLYQDFNNIIRRSTQISGTGERQRNIFFNNLLTKIRERKLAAQ
jgi:hypothetical protein